MKCMLCLQLVHDTDNFKKTSVDSTEAPHHLFRLSSLVWFILSRSPLSLSVAICSGPRTGISTSASWCSDSLRTWQCAVLSRYRILSYHSYSLDVITLYFQVDMEELHMTSAFVVGTGTFQMSVQQSIMSCGLVCVWKEMIENESFVLRGYYRNQTVTRLLLVLLAFPRAGVVYSRHNSVLNIQLSCGN